MILVSIFLKNPFPCSIFQSVLSSFSFRQLKPVMNMRGLDSEQQISQSALFALQKSSANLNTNADEK